MLARLAKLAARSAQLRKMAMQKQAIVGVLAKGVGKVGRWAAKNPLTAATGALGAAVAPGAVSGTYRQHMAGFNPDVQQAMQGSAPVPPGAQ